jgi:hypothetical protein
MIQLIYLSDFVADEAALGDILASAVRHNTAAGITGMLLYAGGNFLQVLEGEADAVHATYRRIAQDRRHKNLNLLVEEEIGERQFDRWSMGFHALSDADQLRLPKFAPYFRYGFDRGAITARPGVALELLQRFSEGNL